MPETGGVVTSATRVQGRDVVARLLRRFRRGLPGLPLRVAECGGVRPSSSKLRTYYVPGETVGKRL